MKQIYILENLDCANCAAKIEASFNAHPGVEEATITFATRQLRLSASDPDSLLPELTAIARKVEPDFTIRPKQLHNHPVTSSHRDHRAACSCDHDHSHTGNCGCTEHHHHTGNCGCAEHHHHAGNCTCAAEHPHQEGSAGDEESPRPLWIGGGLFLAGLILDHLGFGWLSFGICFAAWLLLGRQVVAAALKNLKTGHVFDENFLMSVATLGAFTIGQAPEAVGVMLFYRVGEFFEHRAVERSRSQIMEAVDLRPETVLRLEGENTCRIDAGEARVGDLLVVRPGDRIPLDGTVVSGESRLDTAPITGEPVPVGVRPGSSVISGCVNLSGQLTVRVEKDLGSSMVTRILDSVENAAANKPRLDRFITRFARIYTPVVVAIALATAVIPSLVTGNWNYWVYTALSFLVMSCPCALVLSVPLSFFAGIGVGSRHGILFKGGQSMEALAGVKAVVLDKTGTITQGDFRVQQVTGGEELLRLCASCEQRSSHPIARSIVDFARQQGITLSPPDALEELPGRGIRAKVDNRSILCGNAQLLQEHGIAQGWPEERTGTSVLVAIDGQYAGFITISDTVKPGAKEAVARLTEKGITVVMLTGDAEETAGAVARQLGIREYFSRLLPGGKLERLGDIRSRLGRVMFVGDGINDAPVLAGADVGAAMGSGADAAIEAADVVFLTSTMEAIPQALEIAGNTRRIAWQNVIFALAVKALVMLLGLCGFASMWLAVFADSGVAMLCVLNSIRMLYQRNL